MYLVADGLDMVDINQLDQLEMDLADIERTLVEENLDQQYKDLQQSHDQVKKWVIDYTDNISQLRRDVDNIEEIKNSLPDGCFKNVELEPDAGRWGQNSNLCEMYTQFLPKYRVAIL